MTTVLDKPETTIDSIECNPEILERLILTNLIALNAEPDEDISGSGWALTDLLRSELEEAVDLMLAGYNEHLMTEILESCINFIVDTAAVLTSKNPIEAHQEIVEQCNALKVSIREKLDKATKKEPKTREDRARDKRKNVLWEARGRGEYDDDEDGTRFKEDLRKAEADPIGVQ